MKADDIRITASPYENGIAFDKPMIHTGEYMNTAQPNADKIVFSPRIVVNTGNNNTITDDGAPGSESNPGTYQLPSNIERGMGVRNVSIPEPVKMNPAEESREVVAEKPNSVGGGLFDFAKGFFIKKMG
jgi:hypothetical protein